MICYPSTKLEEISFGSKEQDLDSSLHYLNQSPFSRAENRTNIHICVSSKWSCEFRSPIIDSAHFCFKSSSCIFFLAQWLSGRELDSRQRGRWFDQPASLYCVLESKTHLSLLSTGSTQEDLFQHN